MNRYELIRGFDTFEGAKSYADRLPPEAIAKVVPVQTGKFTFTFAVDCNRDYTGGRI